MPESMAAPLMFAELVLESFAAGQRCRRRCRPMTASLLLDAAYAKVVLEYLGIDLPNDV